MALHEIIQINIRNKILDFDKTYDPETGLSVQCLYYFWVKTIETQYGETIPLSQISFLRKINICQRNMKLRLSAQTAGIFFRTCSILILPPVRIAATRATLRMDRLNARQPERQMDAVMKLFHCCRKIIVLMKIIMRYLF